ncbi:UDP-glycosyltransferase 89A2-like [Silene latifolia]|uniref:UDP-glycosyltransferase 89A2-like n=1 Tax=Silene latifolia TaxID=37657 RepID=UPI003D788973
MFSPTTLHTVPATATTNHILVFPYPAQGHMLALLDLTHQLALHGFKITILVTPKNLPLLNSLLTTHPNSVNPLVLPFPTHPNLPFGVENVKDIGNAGNAPIILSLKKLEEQVIQWFQSNPSPPQAILSDFFLGYTNNWAHQLGIPRFAFFSTRAFLSLIIDHVLENIDTLWNLHEINFPNIPRSPTFVHHQLPSMFKAYKNGDTNWISCKNSMLENFKSYGIVFNTYYALEAEYLDYIKMKVGHDRVYSVGPLNAIGLSRVNPDSGIGYDVLNWVDKWSDGSVLFVCFGSQKMLTKPQMEALALGLERSGVRFIWVVKAETSHMVPDGFEKRVADRALIVHGWAPQTEILSHKAIGGFVSHCGWNSTLESIMAGVMILAWPMEADQFVNARLLVEDMGSAVGLCEGEDTVPDSEMLSRVIEKSMGRNIVQRERAKVIREMAFEAIKSGGSSMKDLDALVKKI